MLTEESKDGVSMNEGENEGSFIGCDLKGTPGKRRLNSWKKRANVEGPNNQTVGTE